MMKAATSVSATSTSASPAKALTCSWASLPVTSRIFIDGCRAILARVAVFHIIHVQHEGRARLEVGDLPDPSHAHELKLDSGRLGLTFLVIILAGLNGAVSDDLKSPHHGDQTGGCRHYVRSAGLGQEDAVSRLDALQGEEVVGASESP